jgi:hypothetical protein
MRAVEVVALLIPIGLPPPVFVDHIGQYNAAHRTEAAHRIADWQRRIGMHIPRQVERRFDLLLEIQVKRRQGRPETEGSRRQQHVLDGRIN